MKVSFKLMFANRSLTICQEMMVKADIDLIFMFTIRKCATSQKAVRSVAMHFNMIFIVIKVISRNLVILKKEKRLRKITFNNT